MIQSISTQTSTQLYQQTQFSQILIFKHSQDQLATILKKCKDQTHHQLVNQLQVLTKLQSVEGFPKIISANYQQGNILKSLQIQKLGISVKTLISNSISMNVEIPLSIVIKLGFQMLQRIQVMHEWGYLHMDLKPQHFLFQTHDIESCLYLIDFGLSTKFSNKQVDKFTSKNCNGVFKGNIAYASINKMKMKHINIRDDLQSILYIIVEMLEGQLPWKQIKKTSSNNKCWKSLFSKTLSKKIKKNQWKKYGVWINNTLNKIQQSQDPYNCFRKSIYKLFQFQN